MQFTIMYKFTAHFATDVTALRLGEKLEDAGVAVARRVVCYGRVAATAALQLRLRLRCVSFDFSANARDAPERSFAGTEQDADGAWPNFVRYWALQLHLRFIYFSVNAATALREFFSSATASRLLMRSVRKRP